MACATRMRLVLEVMTEAPPSEVREAVSDPRWQDAVIKQIANRRWPETYYETAIMSVAVAPVSSHARIRRKR